MLQKFKMARAPERAPLASSVILHELLGRSGPRRQVNALNTFQTGLRLLEKNDSGV
jgi:hypothetical protein